MGNFKYMYLFPKEKKKDSVMEKNILQYSPPLFSL